MSGKFVKIEWPMEKLTLDFGPVVVTLIFWFLGFTTSLHQGACVCICDIRKYGSLTK